MKVAAVTLGAVLTVKVGALFGLIGGEAAGLGVCLGEPRDGDEGELGLEELPGPRGVLAIEWAERLRGLPWTRPLRVQLWHGGGDERRLRVEEVA